MLHLHDSIFALKVNVKNTPLVVFFFFISFFHLISFIYFCHKSQSVIKTLHLHRVSKYVMPDQCVLHLHDSIFCKGHLLELQGQEKKNTLYNVMVFIIPPAFLL